MQSLRLGEASLVTMPSHGFSWRWLWWHFRGTIVPRSQIAWVLLTSQHRATTLTLDLLLSTGSNFSSKNRWKILTSKQEFITSTIGDTDELVNQLSVWSGERATIHVLSWELCSWKNDDNTSVDSIQTALCCSNNSKTKQPRKDGQRK